MRRNNYLLIIILFLLCISVDAQDLTFDRLSEDLGVIDIKDVKDDIIYCDFNFTNTSDIPLRIWQVLSTCGCSTSLWSKTSYEPGDTGAVRLSYRPSLRKERRVTMHADVYMSLVDPESERTVYNLKMEFEIEGEREALTPFYKIEKSAEEVVPIQNADVYDTILERVADVYISRYSLKNEMRVIGLVNSMREGGYWQHIDYDCFFRTNWQPIEHLENIHALATAYVSPTSSYYGSPSLYSVIEEGMKYWDSSNPTSHNWWYNDIGGSQVLVEILVLLSRSQRDLPDILPKELYDSLSDKLAKSDSKKWTGANKLDIARHHLYRGCLLKNDSIVRSSANEVFFPVRITEQEGIQEDMSYQQHGAQLYMGGYGIVFVFGISEIAYMLSGTAYALPEDQQALFSRFVKDGFLKVFRGPYIDWSVTGRGISRRGIVDNRGKIEGRSIVSVIEWMGEVDPQNSEYYQQAKERFLNDSSVSLGIENENIMFYRSDYMVHNAPSYQATVRSVSNRCIKAENGNGENLLSSFMSDGAFNIRQSGDEYLDIFPVWEWDKIPGVTSAKTLPAIAAPWRVPGTSKLTGGVSDGSVGAFAYKHDDHGHQAIKGWFFWEDMVVALGAGITADKFDLHTTLDQSYLLSDVTFKQKKITTVDNTSVLLNNPEYIIHNQMAYVPLQDGNLLLRAGMQSGNWIDINYNQANRQVRKEVFNLIWEHPKGDTDASYSYLQIPAYKSIKQIKALRKSVEVVNTPILQAVYRESNNKAMAVFYGSSTYNVNNWQISVDRPSLLLIEGINSGNQLKITAVNLEGDSKPIQVNLQRGENKFEIKIETDKMRPSAVVL